MSVINQMRTIHDDKNKNHFDILQLTMQKNRTKINSAPTVKCYNEKGNVYHEPPPKTTKSLNHHDSLNHSVVVRSNNI